MISSMTGFAAVQREGAKGTLAVELRAVNHRYLELHMRLDDALRAFEPTLRDAISARLQRGKVECRVSLLAPAGQAAQAELNGAVLDQLAELSAALKQRFPESAPLSVAEILRWPGVVAAEAVSADALAGELAVALEQGLEDLAASRAREGEKLAAVILDRVAQMDALVAKTRPMLPALLSAYQDKLASRIREALQTADDARIHQELALYAQKIDVDEELERLSAHLGEVRRVLRSGGAVGKRLDFLMQELNREANTLGSKSVSSETSQVSMELKVLIEQMREQVQNIE